MDELYNFVRMVAKDLFLCSKELLGVSETTKEAWWTHVVFGGVCCYLIINLEAGLVIEEDGRDRPGARRSAEATEELVVDCGEVGMLASLVSHIEDGHCGLHSCCNRTLTKGQWIGLRLCIYRKKVHL